ncbi:MULTISPECIES: DUF1543 domain-containing protein [unclassified Leclercia]|uniref:DUF1543 domain-containing protein n=1 Tax=Leclercia barmai TaxID=2785629 RepID=A0ABS7RTU0_9ENTR|nr:MULTISPECIES: DUF1543 domain-containing protein [unclassified Leclercia]MBZ0057278.1 DUF1543 domain-containing protein [Leclercia sp. EMC7]MCM5695448.1 DUF1543 domain-containing protein [Leclercia sp. LTM01]MCM5699855.1 DUF1543 domain-containing protein [Leclercia sp. LTM14]
MNLYMFYIGGNAGKSNIEVHDIQFVAANQPKDAWPALREAWFGDSDKIHIDGYSRITWADGYSVSLSPEPSPSAQKLFFVNAGGYRPDTLAELHEYDLFVAENAQGAKKKAMKTLLCGVDQQHKDNLKEVDDCLLLEKIGDLFIHLTPRETGVRDRPEWQGYQPIGV